LAARNKAPAWQTMAVPKFKPVQSGKYYVLVTTTGTAHLLGRWQADFVPILVIALLGLAVCLAHARKRPVTSSTVTSSG
jgi:hypothetical protein